MNDQQKKKMYCSVSTDADGAVDATLQLPEGDEFSVSALTRLLSALIGKASNQGGASAATVEIILAQREPRKPPKQFISVHIDCGDGSRDVFYRYIELIKLVSENPLNYNNLVYNPYAYVD